MGESVAQFRQGGAAQQRADEQAIRLQSAADLHQRAGQVVDRLQARTG